MASSAWPDGMPQVGDVAERRRTVDASVIAHKPITRLRTTVTRQDGVVAVTGTAVCYTVPLHPRRA